MTRDPHTGEPRITVADFIQMVSAERRHTGRVPRRAFVHMEDIATLEQELFASGAATYLASSGGSRSVLTNTGLTIAGVEIVPDDSHVPGGISFEL